MALGFGKPHFLGIDFGTASIKAVELSVEDGRLVLMNYGQISLADLENGTPPRGRSYDEEIMLHLQVLLERMKPKSRLAYVAMPAYIGLISLVEFPAMEESELEEAVRFEAHKYIPSSLDDIALSWEVIGRQSAPDATEKMEVLLVAALNKEVARYERYVSGAGLSVDFLELETFSLVRSIVGEEPSLSLMIDIGSRATNLVLVENGLVKVSRNIDIGGRDVTRALAESLNITEKRANIFKLPVVLGNPWRNLEYDRALTEKIQESGGAFSIAIGLALRGTETLTKKKEELFPSPKKKFSLKELFIKKI